MTRYERTRILIQGDPSLRARFAAEVRARCRIQVLHGPSWGLVMLTQRESARNTLFHPGEVLTSETKAQVDGAIGLGILIGDDLAASEELALIDGAWNAGCSFAAEWLPSLLEENEALELRQGRDNAAILRTKVDFQTMAAEPVL